MLNSRITNMFTAYDIKCLGKDYLLRHILDVDSFWFCEMEESNAAQTFFQISSFVFDKKSIATDLKRRLIKR